MKRTNQRIKGKNQGITIISLIVTIIILLILAGVTIAMLTNSGIIDKANDAAKATNLAETREKLGLDILDKQSELMSGKEKRGELTQGELEDIIEKYGELQEDGDTIVTEYGNISLKEVMSGSVTVADTDTSENGNNTQTLQELSKKIDELEDKVSVLEKNNNSLENAEMKLLSKSSNRNFTLNTMKDMSSFIRTEETIINDYLEYDSTNKEYKVIKPGWYIIEGMMYVYTKANRINGHCYLIVNGKQFILQAQSRINDINIDTNTLTIYLPKDSTISVNAIIDGDGTVESVQATMNIYCFG